MKRLFDLVLSICGILFLLPFFIIVSILIKLDSDGDVIFKQIRVTKNGKEFKIFKFRTMRPNTEKQGQITIGADNRITSIGRFLRKTKLDELPQLFNIVIGDMSFVGPRPEVPKYVAMYTEDQKEILKVRAGITDYASIYFSNESEILGKQREPEKFYIEKIMPYKIELNKKYIKEAGLITDIKIIFLTIFKVAGLIKNDNKFEEEF
ncbi:sugar transferase [Cetobacterium sp. 2G large]|uniref:sugar transferase n=1 Tax=Cetobacterium sp. 2G large TaxID=2759680 RepID=UPI00163CB34F|nr:sugar transferase [Cetobacterium sp. 2G large]MBC2852535.1 sugar transferase [Cetobacterium sp. 2G large]